MGLLFKLRPTSGFPARSLDGLTYPNQRVLLLSPDGRIDFNSWKVALSMHLTKATSRTVLSFFAIATAFTLATATPATASGFDTSANPTAETDEGVIFSVLGDVGDGVGSIVSDEELAQLGIEVTPGTASSAPTVQAEPAPTARAAATNNVLFRWNDFGGRQVVLRSQPYDKILNKHNLTYRTPRVVTQKA